MASDLLTIARSGAMAARSGLDVTAQNIANAGTEGYVRRSVSLAEIAVSGSVSRPRDISLAGVRLDRIVRNADAFRQSEVRRTDADAARATAEVAGLGNVELAIEQSNVHDTMVSLEAALQRLASDPVDTSLRADVVENARTLSSAFNIACTGLDAVRDGIQTEAGERVTQVNAMARELARVNQRLGRAADASSDQIALLDRRDLLLRQLSEHVDIATRIAPGDKTVEVRVGGASGPLLVDGGTPAALAMTTAADGTIGFTLGPAAVTPAAGALAGAAQALTGLRTARASLDGIADAVIATLNGAQAGGVALDGSAGQPLLAGSGAGGIAVVLGSGAGIATAPAGAPAGSRDMANLTALRGAFAGAGLTGDVDALMFDVSSTVASGTVTRDALQTIADTARASLDAQSGVDIDTEAVNLVRFQQAFQASGRVMQVASTLFDTLLGIGR